jgi:endoglucanase
MNYSRPVSSCGTTASDLAGEIVAALSAASIVFEEDRVYSKDLVDAAEKLFELAATNEDPKNQGTYTMVGACGGEARAFYNSSGYQDELVWAGTWLFFPTGNTSYLDYVREGYNTAEVEETPLDKGIFYWNNKLTANAVIL